MNDVQIAIRAKEKAAYILDQLKQAYGERFLEPCPGNLKELILTILSHRTNKRDETEAFNRMWSRFDSWEAIQHAPLDSLIEALSPSRFPERKAPYIQATLSAIYADRGEYNIDFLADTPTPEAMAWLLALPGVGVKTASLVMLFCFHRPVMPVDTHVHRVTMRVGVIPQKTSAEKAHELLLTLLPEDAATLYNFHKLVLKHGQDICTFNYPRCPRCVLKDNCDYYATVHIRTYGTS